MLLPIALAVVHSGSQVTFGATKLCGDIVITELERKDLRPTTQILLLSVPYILPMLWSPRFPHGFLNQSQSALATDLHTHAAQAGSLHVPAYPPRKRRASHRFVDTLKLGDRKHV